VTPVENWAWQLRQVLQPEVSLNAELLSPPPPPWSQGDEKLSLFREVVGNPFCPIVVDPNWLLWNGGMVGKIAAAIYADRTFEQMPVLGDALEDAGCTNTELLAHCRQTASHVRGCWALDLLLGRT
jgi:hypothetical protein